MKTNKLIVFILAAAVVISSLTFLTLKGCGGGGGGGGGAPAEGLGDTGNYFPSTVGNTWTYRVTSSTSGAASFKSGAVSFKFPGKLLNLIGKHTKRVLAAGAPTVNSTTVSITGTKVINGVTVIVFANGVEENYYLKDNNGITYYGNNDTTDALTPQLIPYQMVNFPLQAGSNFVQVNKPGLDYGEDLDGDGKNETVDVNSVCYRCWVRIRDRACEHLFRLRTNRDKRNVDSQIITL